MATADKIVQITISRSGLAPSQADFGTLMIAAYHTKYTDRVRAYSDPSGLVADGFVDTDPAYMAASAAFAQNPRPTTVKVGRRALAFSQVIDLVPPSSPVVGDVYSVTIAGQVCSYTVQAGDDLAAVCTGLAAAVTAGPGADVPTAIVATGASKASPQTLSGTALNGAVGGGILARARRLQVVLSASASWTTGPITVTGKDEQGATITENFAVAGGGGATVQGTKYFRQVTSVAVPAQGGTAGTFTVGTRAPVGAVGTGGTQVVVTTVRAGSLETYEAISDNLGLLDATTDPGLSTDLDAILQADRQWYGLALDSNGAAETEAAAAWTESRVRLFGAQTADTACMDPTATTDVMSVLKTAAYSRTFPSFARSIALATSWYAAAWMGRMFPLDAGSATWAFKTLSGVAAYDLTDTQRNSILAKNGNVYIEVDDVPITYGEAGAGGKVASGEWIDVMHGLDWFQSDAQTSIFSVFLDNKKVPFTDAGIDIIRTALLASLKRGIGRDIFADDPAPTIAVPRASDVSTTDRKNRKLPAVTFTAQLAGAVHATVVSGVVTS